MIDDTENFRSRTKYYTRSARDYYFMTVTNMVIVVLTSGDGVSVVVVVWYGRGYCEHCRRDQTNRAAVAVAVAAAVPPKREARRRRGKTDR